MSGLAHPRGRQKALSAPPSRFISASPVECAFNINSTPCFFVQKKGNSMESSSMKAR